MKQKRPQDRHLDGDLVRNPDCKPDDAASERKSKLDNNEALTLEKLTRTLVIVPILNGASPGNSSDNNRTDEARLNEAVGLAHAIDLDICTSHMVRVNRPRPSHLFGTGKVAEFGAIIGDEDIELVIIDHALTPGQQRNLERAWAAKVIDRTGLILEIFADRAQTREGTLQSDGGFQLVQ